MKTSKSFPPVSCRYGAPMGRADTLPDTPAPVRLRLARARATDYAYDQGGAYWGGPVSEIYCGHNRAGVRIYARAKSPRDAAAAILAKCPPGSTCGGYDMRPGGVSHIATRKAQTALCRERAAWLASQIHA